jgi:hypothetical protein
MSAAPLPVHHAPPSANAAFTKRRSFVLMLAALSAVGPFSIDTFLPALLELQTALHATPIEAQQALSAYLLGFGLMCLWHGAISDALGRRPVILASLLIYIAASVVCTFAPSIEVLIAGRLVQGLAGGAGMIIARAIIRDCFEGVKAMQLMATGRLMSMDEAKAIGLVHECWGDAEMQGRSFADAVMEYARQFTPPHKASRAVGRMKRAVQSGAEAGFLEGLSIERELQQLLFQSDDAREGIAASLEKRKPEFRGR